MSALEDELRATLARRSAAPPPHAAIADSVLDRVASVRRRRLTFSSAASVLLMIFGITGFALLRGIAHPGPATDHEVKQVDAVTKATEFMPYDWVYDRELHTPAGATYPLSSAPQDIRRLGSKGWVYLTGDGTLKLQPTTGAVQDLGVSGNRMAVSGAGSSIAVLNSALDTVSMTRIDWTAATPFTGATATVPDGTDLVAVFGDYVVLRRDSDTGAEFAVWNWHRDFQAKWLGGLEEIYGPNFDGKTLIGAGQHGGRQCLVTIALSGDSLAPRAWQCLRDLDFGVNGLLSPDYKFLLLGSWGTTPGRPVMRINLTRGEWSAADICGQTVAKPVWLSATFAALPTVDGYSGCPNDGHTGVAPPADLPRGATVVIVPDSGVSPA
jgi:hypothetical protein